MTIRRQVILGLLSFFLSIGTSFAQSPRVVCIGADGSLTVREKKCLALETKATMTNLPQQGAKGPTGASGGAGLGSPRVERIAEDYFHYSTLNQSRVFAFCNDDEVVLAGGCGCFNNSACHSRINSSGPMPIDQSVAGRSGWRCAMVTGIGYNGGDAGSFRAYAICAQAN